ncbi:hypothetical protein EG329_005679 [Mollisiaceae sp. DMI_Dod_QoI]|nr:hypothetical protein EG329_005679 [Helotiales sp. DMI_Dod_QoI]
MSSSASKRSRRREGKERKKHGASEGHHDSTPRAYGHRGDLYGDPEDDTAPAHLESTEDQLLLDKVAQLHLDSPEDQLPYEEDYDEINVVEGSARSIGKGKTISDMDAVDDKEDWSEWSEYILDSERNCYYTMRTNSMGKSEYHYYEQKSDPTAEHVSGESQYNYITSSQGEYEDYEPEFASIHAAAHDKYSAAPINDVSSAKKSSTSHSSRHRSSRHSSARHTPSQTYGQTSIGSSQDQDPFYEDDEDAEETPPDQLPPQLIPPFIPPIPECGCGIGHGLCGVIIGPKDPDPTSRKSIDQSTSSSRRSGASKHRSTSSKMKGNAGSASGSNGQNCGPLVIPGITPSPEPPQPGTHASRQERHAYEKWLTRYEEWKYITCPCGVQEGDEPFNPLWDDNGGQAPMHIRERPPNFPFGGFGDGLLVERNL